MVFSFFWIFCTSLPNQVEYASNFNSKFVSMSELELFLLTGVLTPNFNTMDLVKILAKKSKTLHLDCSSHIEGDIMQNHKQKKK
jgi:hypothetical protein